MLRRADGTSLALPARAFDTLACLVAQAGQVVTKEALMRAVWPDTIVEENNLAQQISLLRRLLNEAPGHPRAIVTVPGRGYQLSAAVIADTLASEPAPAARVAPAQPSVVVLPFVNVGDVADDDVFADGLTDELIVALSRQTAWRVVARTSAFAFKGTTRDVRAIAAALGVTLLVEGSVRWSGRRLRVTTVLVDAADGCHLWSHRFERDAGDLFALQDELARAVVDAIVATVPSAARILAVTPRTTSPVAHEHYLKGRFHLLRMTEEGVMTGLQWLEQSVEVDPAYAPAHVGLAHAFRMQALSLEMPPADVAARGREAAMRAVALDATLAEAEAVLGFHVYWFEWDWAEAEARFQRALALDPHSVDTLWMYAHLHSRAGRHDQALGLLAQARHLDPLSALVHAMEGQLLLHAGQIDAAIARLREARELDPRSRVAHLFAASAHLAAAQYDEAASAAAAARQLTPANTQALALEIRADARRGRRRRAEHALKGLLELSRRRYVSPYHLALACDGVGDEGEALTWLERGYDTRDPKMTFLASEPVWAPLRDHPRVRALLERMR